MIGLALRRCKHDIRSSIIFANSGLIGQSGTCLRQDLCFAELVLKLFDHRARPLQSDGQLVVLRNK